MANMEKNLFGANIAQDVVMPVLGGAAGFLAARAIGNFWAQEDILSSDPRVAKTIAAGVGIPATLFLSGKDGGMIQKNRGAIMLGMGLAASESWLRDTKLLGGGRMAAAVTAEAEAEAVDADAEAEAEDGAADPDPPAEGAGAYYDYPTNRQGQALSAYYDYPTNRQGQALSGDYYTSAMLGSDDPGDQGQIDSALDQMDTGVEAISTVVPTDLAMVAPNMPQVAPVSEHFASGDKGYAGGVFARHLFSGMMGS